MSKLINFFAPHTVPVHVWQTLTNVFEGIWSHEQVAQTLEEMGYKVSQKQLEAIQILCEEQQRLDRPYIGQECLVKIGPYGAPHKVVYGGEEDGMVTICWPNQVTMSYARNSVEIIKQA